MFGVDTQGAELNALRGVDLPVLGYPVVILRFVDEQE